MRKEDKFIWYWIGILCITAILLVAGAVGGFWIISKYIIGF